MEDDTAELLPGEPEVGLLAKVTPYRWVILTLFSLFSLLQSGVWDTWGPISDSATKVIGFTDHDYDLLSNWAPIGIMTTMPIFIWLMNNKGPRLPLIIANILVAAGTGLRCIPVTGVALKYCIHTGQLLSAMAGCMVLGAGPLLSNLWFKPSERILATSSMICLGNLGNALSYLIGPAIVDSPVNCTAEVNISTTTPKIMATVVSTTTETLTTGCPDNTDEMRKQIDYYLYGEFAFAVIICILTIIFFRNKPPSPPSLSAATERLNILAGLKALSRNFAFWATVLSFALVNGAYYGWYGIITVILRGKTNAVEVSRVAFVMTLVGTAAGIVVGWFADRIKGRLKWILFACYCAMFIVFLCIVIMVMGWTKAFPLSDGAFWATFIIFGSLSSIIQPLGMEMAADIAYPVNEGTSTSIVAFCIMLAMFVFLLILNSVTVQFIANYLVLIFVGIAAPVLAFTTKDRNVRLGVDGSNVQENSNGATD